MKSAFLFTGRLLVFVIFAAFAPPVLASEPCGHVESAKAGFWAARGSRIVKLDSSGDVFEFDILETDAAGAATVRFIDRSALEMMNGARVDIREVVFAEERNRFNIGIMHGAARVITGGIARINPGGFKIITPRTMIGVRGTALFFEVSENFERMTVESLSEDNVVIYTVRATGETWTLTRPGDSISISATPDDSGAAEVEPLGEGVTRGDRDPRGLDRSGAGDNPREARIKTRDHGGNGDRERGRPGGNSSPGESGENGSGENGENDSQDE
jgi:hypothetical protein